MKNWELFFLPRMRGFNWKLKIIVPWYNWLIRVIWVLSGRKALRPYAYFYLLISETHCIFVSLYHCIVERFVFVHKVESLSYNVQERGLRNTQNQGVDFHQWSFEYERNKVIGHYRQNLYSLKTIQLLNNNFLSNMVRTSIYL